ncbi:hypothetical protein [Streptomyces rhizosphaericus]|uniref:hypothetical protein n=1 Tax=Streptomyces rhizosphaericus TaxID=114699 RepID=UPI00363A42D1
MERTAGRPGTRRTRLRTAVAVCAVALGTLATLGTPANAAPGTTTSAAPNASSHRAARAGTPWKLRTPLSETASREFWDVAATGAKDAWAVGRRTDGAVGPAP